jgi:D-alanyl-lipoteichoic acid acyltransferase DltB (MBOAT superfamily)
MLLTSYSFLFFFLPISLLSYFLFFEKNLKSKVIYLGIISSYFYFLDNGFLLLILIFLAFLTKIQIEKKIFSNFFYVLLSLTPLIIFKYSYILFSLLNFEMPTFIKNNFPIGLSFFTFQAIAYYFDKNRLQKNESTFYFSSIFSSTFSWTNS